MHQNLPNDRLLHEIWTGSPTGIAIVSREGRFLSVSPSYCSFLGYTEGELQWLKFADITLIADRAADIEAADKLAADPEGESYRMVKTYVGKFGGPLRCIIDVLAMRSDGEFICYLVFCQPLSACDYKVEQNGGNVVVRPAVNLLALWRDNRRVCLFGLAVAFCVLNALDIGRLIASWKVIKNLFGL